MLRLRWRLQCTAAEPERGAARRRDRGAPTLAMAFHCETEVDDPSYFFARAFQMSLPLLFIALGPWRLRDGPAWRIYMPATGCAPPIKHNEDDGCPSRHVRARTLFRTKSRFDTHSGTSYQRQRPLLSWNAMSMQQ